MAPYGLYRLYCKLLRALRAKAALRACPSLRPGRLLAPSRQVDEARANGLRALRNGPSRKLLRSCQKAHGSLHKEVADAAFITKS